MAGPLATLAASKAANQGVQFVSNNWKPVTLTIAGIALLYFGPKYYRKVRAKNYANNNIGNPNVIAAAIIYESFTKIGFADSNLLSYIFPEKFLWTDEAQLYSIAHQVTSIDDVAEAYNIMFEGRVLLNDIQRGLSTNEMKNFFDIIKNKTYNDSDEAYLIGAEIYCAKDRISVKEVTQENGAWVDTGELYDTYEFRDYIGKVHDTGVYEPENKRYYIVRWCYLYTLVGCVTATYGIVWQDQVTNKRID